MGILTKNDMEIIESKITAIEYGTLELEFREGQCVAVCLKARTLTEKGLSKLLKGKPHLKNTK